MASYTATWTIAISRILLGPGRGTEVVMIACTAIAFQSATASARAGAAQLRYPQTSRPVSFRNLVIVTSPFLLGKYVEVGRPNLTKFAGISVSDADDSASTPANDDLPSTVVRHEAFSSDISN